MMDAPTPAPSATTLAEAERLAKEADGYAASKGMMLFRPEARTVFADFARVLRALSAPSAPEGTAPAPDAGEVARAAAVLRPADVLFALAAALLDPSDGRVSTDEDDDDVAEVDGEFSVAAFIAALAHASPEGGER